MPRQPLLIHRLLLALAPRVTPFERPALVVAPHQDDETFGCGGVIAAKRERGVPVKVVFMTDGSRSHGELDARAAAALVARRQEEARVACATLGVPPSDVYFLGLPDGRLSTISFPEREAAVARLQELLRELQPGEIFVTYRRDRHKDHEASFALTVAAREAWGQAVDLYEYPIWVCNQLNRWLQRVGPGAVRRARSVPLDLAALARKREAVAAHASQLETLPTGFPDLFLTRRELFFYSRFGA